MAKWKKTGKNKPKNKSTSNRSIGCRIMFLACSDSVSCCMWYVVVLQIKWNSILHIIRVCFCDVSMNNSRLFDADSALCLI